MSLRFGEPYNPTPNHLLPVALILAGCTANGLRNIYLLSLSYNDHTGSSGSNISTAIQSIVGNTTHTLEVRIGFLGTCVRLPLDWVCSPDFKTTTNRVSEVFAGTNTSSAELYDPLGLLYISRKLEDEVIFAGLMLVSSYIQPYSSSCELPLGI